MKASRRRTRVIATPAIQLTPAQAAEDLAVWQRYMRTLPSEETLDNKIATHWDPPLSSYDMQSLWRKFGLTTHHNLNLKELFVEFQDPSISWFTTGGSRILYEVMLASYLPLVGRQDVIDLKVAIDEGLSTEDALVPVPDPDLTETDDDSIRPCASDSANASSLVCPEKLDAYISNWVQYLTSDPAMMGGGGALIVRRLYLLVFYTDFIQPSDASDSREGHQLLIAVERNFEAGVTSIYIVDNVRRKDYKYAFQGWLTRSLRKNFRQFMPHIQIGRILHITNRMPTQEGMASCMSVSFRAMVLFSFLRDPIRRIEERIRVDDGRRFMKLMYFHLDRMRRQLLIDGRIGLAYPDGYHPTFVPQEMMLENGGGRGRFGLHTMDTRYLWMVGMREFIDPDTLYLNADGSAMNIQEWIKRFGYRDGAPCRFQFYFNHDFDSPEAFRQTPYVKPCTVQAHYPLRFFGLFS